MAEPNAMAHPIRSVDPMSLCLVKSWVRRLHGVAYLLPSDRASAFAKAIVEGWQQKSPFEPAAYSIQLVETGLLREAKYLRYPMLSCC